MFTATRQQKLMVEAARSGAQPKNLSNERRIERT